MRPFYYAYAYDGLRELNMTMLDESTLVKEAARHSQSAAQGPSQWATPDLTQAKKAAERPSTEPALPAVEITNLDLFYAKQQALQNVSLVIPEKQVTAFIG